MNENAVGLDNFWQCKDQGVRAERLFLFFALSLFGIALIRPEVLLPAPFDFIQASHADPVLNQQSGAQTDPPKTKSAAVDHELPAFVPDHQTLTFASDREAEPDAKSKARDCNSRRAVESI